MNDIGPYKTEKAGAAMGSLGWQEIIIIFILALIIFGPRKLPDLGKTIGKGLAEFKRASNELKQTWEEEVRLDHEKESMAEIISDVKKDAAALSNDIIPTDPPKNNDDSVGSKDIQ
jgi:sec-independent protein translocase protein TatA